MSDIFISYSSHDREKALLLAEELRSLGTSVWIDQAIAGATRWSSEIAQALDECKALILLISQSSLSSKNCVKEVTIAAEADKQILPIDLEDIPLSHEFKYHLAGIQRVAYTNKTAIRRALEKLISTNSKKLGVIASQPKDNLIRLAVLPFSDLSPMHDNEWFADGMMDELISTLGSLTRMRVPSRMDVIHYKKNRPKIKQIARDLNVRYLIEGSVRKAGERIRISASLIDSASDWLLWSQNFNGTFENIFDFQEQTSKAIAEVLKLELTSEEEKILIKNPTDNPEAYQLYLKGIEHTARVTKTDFMTALSLFEEAVKLDPHFSAAYSEIAITCSETFRVYSRLPVWLERAEAAAKHIFEIEGETAQYHLAASGIDRLRGKLKDALYHAKRSVEIDPGFAIGYQSMGSLYHLLGDYRLSMESWEKAIQLRPDNTNTNLRYIMAIAQFGDVKMLHTAAVESVPIFERHIRLNPDDNTAKVELENVLDYAGRVDEAIASADTLSMIPELDGFSLYNLSCIYARCSAPDKAVTNIRRAADAGYRNIELIKNDSDLNSLREREDFQVVVRELEDKISKEECVI